MHKKCSLFSVSHLPKQVFLSPHIRPFWLTCSEWMQRHLVPSGWQKYKLHSKRALHLEEENILEWNLIQDHQVGQRDQQKEPSKWQTVANQKLVVFEGKMKHFSPNDFLKFESVSSFWVDKLRLKLWVWACNIATFNRKMIAKLIFAR